MAATTPAGGYCGPSAGSYKHSQNSTGYNYNNASYSSYDPPANHGYPPSTTASSGIMLDIRHTVVLLPAMQCPVLLQVVVAWDQLVICHVAKEVQLHVAVILTVVNVS